MNNLSFETRQLIRKAAVSIARDIMFRLPVDKKSEIERLVEESRVLKSKARDLDEQALLILLSR